MGGQKSLSRRADESFLLLLLLVNWRQLSPRATPFRLPPAIPFRSDCTRRFHDLTRSASFTSTIACLPRVSSISMERLRLPLPGLLAGFCGIHLPAAPGCVASCRPRAMRPPLSYLALPPEVPGSLFPQIERPGLPDLLLGSVDILHP
jgi:hypothetical protein